MSILSIPILSSHAVAVAKTNTSEFRGVHTLFFNIYQEGFR